MKVTVIPVVLGALETVPEDLESEPKELEIGRRSESI